ncbi:MAG TPA: response regulator transcription factor [Candidatus Acidoferrales bacterium]|nr:response regulator transcription factor [Candidatus Acidoferrales bacterium]
MRKRILVADDNELVRKLLHLMLERDAGWEVAVAQDGREAIAKAQEFKPDVVILDFAMPDMDGLQIARQVSKQLPSPAIILFTIHDSPEMNFEARRAGISRVLPKTAAGLPLIAAVEELLTNRWEATPEESREPVPEIVSRSACEPVPDAVSELVSDPATVIAAPPLEPSPEMMQAEAAESAPSACEGEPPPNSSATSATGAT